jgi:para-nitrobenzyl esterase
MLLLSFGLALNFSLITATPGLADGDGFSLVAETEYGEVEGVHSDNNTLAWKGIPFAKPPVGDLRWHRPDDPDEWGGTREACEFSDMCTQYNQQGEIVGSEDCLYLNVWRPNSDEVLPTYVWIHGGGNSVGTAGDSIYDGSNLASSGNVVVVSTNYRLGPLGWFSNPVLRKGKHGTVMCDSGNYGTLDLIQGLKWVKNNIAAFGGDPDNVTIAGESAGGINVYSLLFSPIAAGLFHKAIVQSGFPWTDTVADGDASSDRVINELMAIDGISRDGMKDRQIADYLKSKTAAEILSVYYSNMGFGMLEAYNPTAEFRQVFSDGTVINVPDVAVPPGWFLALLEGEYNKVPIILGTNEEEQKLFLSAFYDPFMDPCVYQAWADLETDTMWDPVVDDVAPLLSAHQPDDVYAYRFLYGTYRHLGPPNCEPDPLAFNAWMDLSQLPSPFTGPNFGLLLGSCHMLDLPFFFGNFEFYGFEPFIFHGGNLPGYELLSDAMIAYVAQFARTGDPGDAGGVVWTPWKDTETGPRILFDANQADNLTVMSTP